MRLVLLRRRFGGAACVQYEWLNSRRRGSFCNPDSAVSRQVVKVLYHSAGPPDRSLHGTFGRAQTEKQVLAMLREKARSSLNRSRLATGLGFDRNGGPNRIAITLCSAQSKGDRRRKVRNDVLQNTQLG